MSDEITFEQIGKYLKDKREAAGVTQDQAALAIGIPRPAVSLLESGQRKVSAVELVKLTKLYGFEIDQFVQEMEVIYVS